MNNADDEAFSILRGSQTCDIDLFAGAGGLSLGLSSAGFCSAALYEADASCCETLWANQSSESPTIHGTVCHGRVEHVDWTAWEGKVRLLAAGVPCQPFSIGGCHESHKDERNLFPELLRAVRQIRPKGVLVENVRGLAREAFRPYFEYVLRQLRFVSITKRAHESWLSHNRRLKEHELSAHAWPEYSVVFRVLDAADFGAPQNRLRLFVVATRHDVPCYAFPQKTHSKASLLRDMAEGTYWERHELKPRSVSLSVENRFFDQHTAPWNTVRDALQGLPAPASGPSGSEINHWRIPGAKSYARHTGSALDWPAKTVKAGVHGVPGGENTVVADNGRLRYFTLRELARLQTFPDTHLFQGSRSNMIKQIGNAVPCTLATAVAAPLTLILNNIPALIGATNAALISGRQSYGLH